MSDLYRFKIDKLIRDKLPDIMQSKNIKMECQIMENSEYLKKLKEKLVEESIEVLDALTKEEIKEKLSDILEVIFCLAEEYDLDLNIIELARRQKNIEKVSFRNKIYCSVVEMLSDNPMINYYLERPEKYPEVK